MRASAAEADPAATAPWPGYEIEFFRFDEDYSRLRDMLWRNTSQDAVYSPANTEIIAPGGHGLYVATQPYVRLDWRPMPLIEWQAAYVRAIPGEALRSTSGRRGLDFGYTSIALRF
jgi:hypothetical protein